MTRVSTNGGAISNSADEAGYSSYSLFNAIAKAKGIESPKIWEGKKGQKSTAVCELDLKVRPLLDELIVKKTTDFIKRNAKGDNRSSPTSPSRMCTRRRRRTRTSTRPILCASAYTRT